MSCRVLSSPMRPVSQVCEFWLPASIESKSYLPERDSNEAYLKIESINESENQINPIGRWNRGMCVWRTPPCVQCYVTSFLIWRTSCTRTRTVVSIIGIFPSVHVWESTACLARLHHARHVEGMLCANLIYSHVNTETRPPSVWIHSGRSEYSK